jgi:hypothetical protein
MPHASSIHPSIRTRLEQCFGCSLGDVRIHTGQNAITSAKRLEAQAFTIGTDIYFGDNCYRPATREGLWLLAHELVHVLQQQRSDSSKHHSACWEQEANAAADLIACGSFLPRDFSITPSPWGSIQCHQDTPCPGKHVELGNNRDLESRTLILGANQSIELAYKHDPENASHADAIFVGTDFERGEIAPPKGAPNKHFSAIVLRELRGLVRQRRPDIIDFVKHVIYEIKPVARATSGTVQRDSYYIVADLIRREHAASKEPPWDIGTARWYPSHILPLLGEPSGKRIVCTEATDHNRWPAMILYDVRELTDEEKKRKQMRRVVSVSVGDFSQNFIEFWPVVRSELKRAIPVYRRVSSTLIHLAWEFSDFLPLSFGRLAPAC